MQNSNSGGNGQLWGGTQPSAWGPQSAPNDAFERKEYRRYLFLGSEIMAYLSKGGTRQGEFSIFETALNNLIENTKRTRDFYMEEIGSSPTSFFTWKKEGFAPIQAFKALEGIIKDFQQNNAPIIDAVISPSFSKAALRVLLKMSDPELAQTVDNSTKEIMFGRIAQELARK